MSTKYYWRRRNAPTFIDGPATLPEIHGQLRSLDSTADVEIVPATGQSYRQLSTAPNWTALHETVEVPRVAPTTPLVDEYGQPFEVRCPVCAEAILSTARKCKHCGEWLPGQEEAAPTAIPKVPVDTAITVDARSSGGAARTVGWLLTICGFLGILFALNMDTSIETGGEYVGFGVSTPQMRVNNLGLMDDRRNYLMIAGLASLIGVVLIVANRERSV